MPVPVEVEDQRAAALVEEGHVPGASRLPGGAIRLAQEQAVGQAGGGAGVHVLPPIAVDVADRQALVPQQVVLGEPVAVEEVRFRAAAVLVREARVGVERDAGRVGEERGIRARRPRGKSSCLLAKSPTPTFNRCGGTLTGELVAFDDTGSAIVERWSRAMGPVVWSNLGVGPDGTIYALSPDAGLQRLDPTDGALLDRTAPLVTPEPLTTARVAIDEAGHVFALLTPVWEGELYVFDADLELLWERSLISSPFGGPTLAPDGSLLIATNGEGIRAWR